MTQLQFPGSRWWKFDFHAHTPASDDFLQGCPQHIRDEVIPEFWLKKFMEKGIHCVAITDHNSGEWIDRLQQKYRELEAIREELKWFRPLHLFPGVEISANGDVHILAILGPEKQTSDIDHLLGAVGYRSTKGKSDGVTTKSITELVDAIADFNGIAIPAHVDQPKGLFKQLSGATLKQVLDNPNIFAMELLNSTYQKPQLYNEKRLPWVEVRGSDTHNFRQNTFGTFTWIKMDEPPSIEGLKLALKDGTASVNCSMSDNPNLHADSYIEELRVDQAKFIGRSESLRCQFSPFLNTIIGGRGSGKSTLLEFMRLALRRKEDIPHSLKEETEKYFRAEGDEDLLVKNSLVSLIYRKGDVRYRLNWSAKDVMLSLEEKKDGEWESVPGDIRSLFPAHIYSQKQIFELARNPRVLLDIIDEAPDVGYATFDEQKRALVNRYKQIELKVQELNEEIAQENRLRGEINDLARQIEQIEKSGHKEVLQNYRRRQQQENEIKRLEKNWQEMTHRLGKMRDDIAPTRFDERHFTSHADMLSAIRETNEKWQTINNGLRDLAREAQSVVDGWQAERDAAAWMQAHKTDMEQYEQLRTHLERQGIDPDKYPLLLTQQRNLQNELQRIGEYRSRQGELEAEKQEVFKKIEEDRKALSEKRQEFLTSVLQKNKNVSIEVKLFGEDWDGVEKEIRRILHCGDRYVRDFERLKDIYDSSDDQKIDSLKRRIEGIRSEEETPRDGRFRNHLQSLPQESMSDFSLWFPADDLKITFGPKNQPIEQGSPGQKTAALLAFILSYGSEPLLLDQPEDDLDNELIYELIVQQLRETKSRRQVIVVTHNANIVVNGDAEMVFPLNVETGETHVRQAASIQEGQIRRAICDILEGGQQAFEQRYRRIHLEN